jgi:dTDP-4-amino-4,6-dideoxygalactose transaminase
MLGTHFADWPSYTEEEISAVSAVLRSNRVNYWTGQECREFEKEFALATQVPYAIALANGTVALDLCWKVLEIQPGDEIIVTPRTFLASASSIVNAGAVPVFADVDPDSQNITPETAMRVITKKTRAILCVHLAGWPCDMDGFKSLAKAHDLLLVEDCAQANGAAWRGKPVGSLSDMAAWSFCQDKIMTTGGEGGMVTTSRQELWSKGWSFKDHGKSWTAVYERSHPPGFRWLHETIGTNWRMLEMQAAIGRVQLKRLPDWSAKRRTNALQIFAAGRQFSALRVPEIPVAAGHAFYKAYVFVEPEALAEGWSRDRIIHEINGLDVPCYQGSCSEVYLEKAFDNAPGRPIQRLPVAKKLGETSLMFLVHPTLEQEHISKTCEVLAKVMKQASR